MLVAPAIIAPEALNFPYPLPSLPGFSAPDGSWGSGVVGGGVQAGASGKLPEKPACRTWVEVAAEMTPKLSTLQQRYFQQFVDDFRFDSASRKTALAYIGLAPRLG